MTKTCPACNGKRTYEVHTYKMHGGERCGSPITLVYACESCRGTGVIHCTACDDTGWMGEYDYTTGEYEGDRPCLHCERGRFLEAQQTPTPVAGTF